MTESPKSCNSNESVGISMEAEDRKQLITLLKDCPKLRTEESRLALLELSGLSIFIPEINLSGDQFVAVSGIVRCLSSYGEPLGVFINTLKGFVGTQQQEFLSKFLTKYGMSSCDNIAQNQINERMRREFEISSHSTTPVLPQSDVSTFTGRELELQQLEKLLIDPKGSELCNVVGISGGGGIGKSALACHFAMKHQDKFSDGVIGLRVDGKDIDTVAREFAIRCGEKLDVEDDRDATTLMHDVFAHRQMLLIFDNAVDANISKLCPRNSRCAVIITTRNRTLSNLLDISDERLIDLNVLSEDDSLTLLKKILGDERVNAELTAAYKIIYLVGNLPLALQIVGASLRKKPRSLCDYAASLEQEKDRLNRLKIRNEDNNLDVEASLNLSLKPLCEEEQKLFACLSVCAEDGFARRTAMAAGDCKDEFEANDYLDRLYELSLLNYTKTGENRFVLHPLVRVYAKNLAEELNLLSLAKERHANFFVAILQSDDVEDATTVAEIAMNLDDVILAAEWIQTRGSDTTERQLETYTFALKLQPLFEQYGHWQKAITLMVQSQVWAEQLKDWNSVVRYKMHEARYLYFSEASGEAIEILYSAQKDLEKIDDLDTRKKREAKLLAVLGGIFKKQGDKEKAINALKNEIIIEKQIEDNRSLAIAYNRLGLLLQSQRYFI